MKARIGWITVFRHARHVIVVSTRLILNIGIENDLVDFQKKDIGK